MALGSKKMFHFYPLESRILLSGEGVDGAETLEVEPDGEVADALAAEAEAAGTSTEPDRSSESSESLSDTLLEEPSAAEGGAQLLLGDPESLDADERIEVVFVDASVEDAEVLIEGLRQDSGEQTQWLVYEISGEADGVEQITGTLSELSSVDAVHLVSHGDGQGLQLGDARLDGNSASGYAADIASWSDALDSEADLLIYGCDLASSAQGRALAEAIGELAGVDVAASDDLTGNADRGGDWHLEYSLGSIETLVAFGAEAQASWHGVLDTATFQQGDANGYSGTQDTEINEGSPDTDLGGATTISIDLANGASESQGLIQFDNLFGTGAGQILSGVQITSAELTLEGVEATSGTVSLHRMLTGWNESSTWNSLTGGLSADDIEMASTADSQVTGATGSGAVTFSGLKDTVQRWANGQSNHGWGILTDSTDGWDFASSESSSVRPLLTIDYIQPGSQASTNHTLTVDTTSDILDGDTTSIDALLADSGADGKISLREAIWATNNTTNDGTPDEIHFSIGSGQQTIALNDVLPMLTDPVVIDATTQPGYDGTPQIELDGSATANFATAGLHIATDDSTISGLLINGFDDEGIEISGSLGHGSGSGNTITGNWIGLDSSGSAAANADNGILLLGGASNNTIQDNVISGNTGAGIEIRGTGSDNNVITGNRLGVSPDGSTAAGNGSYGVWIRGAASGNEIGGTAAGEANTIAFNASDGVRITDAGTTGNSVRGNAIYSNSGLGINLGNDGVTANDSDDTDTGANDLQNFPVLTKAAIGEGTITVSGTVNSASGGTRTIDFYASPSADGSGYGEAKRYLGSITVDMSTTTEAFRAQLSATVAAGEVITATATDSSGSTSEFSAALAAYDFTHSLWLSTESDVSGGGTTGLDSYSEGEAVDFGDPNFTLGSGTTDGTLSTVIDFDRLVGDGDSNVNALHYVTRDMTVGSGANTFDLQQGDVLVTFKDNETVNSGALTAHDEDVLVYRPTTAGDYTSGTFSMLLDNTTSLGGGNEIRGITLAEADTTVGDKVVSEGSFLFTRDGGAEDEDIWMLEATEVGAGTTSGTISMLIQGEDISIDSKLFGIELLEEQTTVGGVTMAAGTILATLDADDTSVGDNGASIGQNDVFSLTVSQTTLVAGTAAADASLLLDGSSAAFDSSGEQFDALTLHEVNRAPVISMPDGAVSYTENDGPVVIDSTATVSDADGGSFAAGTLTVDFTAGSSANDRLAIQHEGTGAGQVGVSGSDVTYEGTIVGTFTGGTDGSTPLAITFNADSTVTAAEAVMQNVTYENVSEDPSTASRTVRFVLNDGDGGTSNTETETINLTAVNDEQSLDTNSGLTLDEGASATITAGDLFTSDPDNTAGELVYTVDATPVNGTLKLSGTALGASGTFTQDDLDNNRVTYTHDDSESTSDSFGFSVDDGAGTVSTGTFNFTITLVNDNSVTSISDTDGSADSVQENSSTGTNVGVTAFADDADTGDTVTYSLDDDAGGRFTVDASTGEVTVADGSLLDHESAASHDITVRASSSDGSASTQSFTIDVSDVNEAPVAVGGESYSTNAGESVRLQSPLPTANDSDVDGDPLSVVIATQPTNGTLSVADDGTLVYQPDSGFFGTETIQYQVSDGALESNVVELEVEVAAVAGGGGSPSGSGGGGSGGEDSSESDAESESEESSEGGSGGGETALGGGGVVTGDLFGRDRGGGEESTEQPAARLGGDSEDSADSRTQATASAASGAEMPLGSAGSRSVYASGGSSVAELEILQHLLSVDLAQGISWQQWDQINQQELGSMNLSEFTIGAAGTTMGLASVGYVLWALRGGMFLGMLSTGIPSWRMIDPASLLTAYRAGRDGRGGDRLDDLMG